MLPMHRLIRALEHGLPCTVVMPVCFYTRARTAPEFGRSASGPSAQSRLSEEPAHRGGPVPDLQDCGPVGGPTPPPIGSSRRPRAKRGPGTGEGQTPLPVPPGDLRLIWGRHGRRGTAGVWNHDTHRENSEQWAGRAARAGRSAALSPGVSRAPRPLQAHPLLTASPPGAQGLTHGVGG